MQLLATPFLVTCRQRNIIKRYRMSADQKGAFVNLSSATQFLRYIFLLCCRYFTGKVDPTQLTNMHWRFRFMQDTFVFYQLLGNDRSALESKFTEPPVSLFNLNCVLDLGFYKEK